MESMEFMWIADAQIFDLPDFEKDLQTHGELHRR